MQGSDAIQILPFWASHMPPSEVREFANDLVTLGVFDSVAQIMTAQPPESMWSSGPVWPPVFRSRFGA